MTRKVLSLMLVLLVLAGVLFAILSATREAKENVRLYAAASLQDVLQAQKKTMPIKLSSKLSLSSAGSQTVARQINEGAPADLVFLAHPDWMDYLEENDRILSGTRIKVLSNRLVVVHSKRSSPPVHSFQNLKQYNNRIAMGDPEAVPAGIYARKALSKAKIWNKVQDKIVSFPHVRAAMGAVASGRAPLGIVYKSDAVRMKEIKIAFEFPPKYTPKISYELAVVKGARKPARKIYRKLIGSGGRDIYESFGFEWNTD